MTFKPSIFLACAALTGSMLEAESSDYPLALNLPTAQRMQYWDLSVAFTHRFEEETQGHSKDLYGLDGFAYPAFGFDLGIKPVPGLNVLVYRTADNKTLTIGLQQQVLNDDYVRMGVRVERFDETVKRTTSALGTVGISGATVQVPAEIFLGSDFIFSLVPTYLSRTTTQENGVFNVGLGLHAGITENFSFTGEYYPRPSKIDSSYKPGWAAGFTYKTNKHRFTLMATNTIGTTANQVLGGDYRGGPGTYGAEQASGKWSIGFNIIRVF
jgi:hypothetical protein